jgi:hypothetical protein
MEKRAARNGGAPFLCAGLNAKATEKAQSSHKGRKPIFENRKREKRWHESQRYVRKVRWTYSKLSRCSNKNRPKGRPTAQAEATG